MGLVEQVRLREAVDGLCAAIDRGEVVPEETEMLALATVVQREGGPLALDLIFKLASRTRNGRVVLKAMAH